MMQTNDTYALHISNQAELAVNDWMEKFNVEITETQRVSLAVYVARAMMDEREMTRAALIGEQRERDRQAARSGKSDQYRAGESGEFS